MIKNILLSSLMLTLLIASLAGCKKEISPTQGEVVAKELQAVIEKNQIGRVYPVTYNQLFPGQFPVNGGTVWSFSNGFIRINNTSYENYNLAYLVTYTISNIILTDGNTARALILYME